MAHPRLSPARAVIAAVTGHRLNQLPEAERPRIQRDIVAALQAIEDAAREAAGGAARCVLHSAIAEGADRFAADAALARGWRLVTPLPFEPERYEQDFPDEESKEHFPPSALGLAPHYARRARCGRGDWRRCSPLCRGGPRSH
jgi:hypothetical protein